MNFQEKFPHSEFGHYVILDATFMAHLVEKRQVNKLVHLFGTVIMPKGIQKELSRWDTQAMIDLFKRPPTWIHIVKANERYFEEFRFGKFKVFHPEIEVLAVAKEAIEKKVDVTICSSNSSVTNRCLENPERVRIRTLNLCQFMTEVALWRMTMWGERENPNLSMKDWVQLQRETREKGNLLHSTPGNQLDRFMGELEILAGKRPDSPLEIAKTKMLLARQTEIALMEAPEHEHGHERASK